MRYTALSVRQPWASLIASGHKKVELRTWRTHYRGELLICAAKHRHGDLPRGVALATVRLVGVRPATRADAESACAQGEEIVAGEFAWELADARPVEPFRVRGQLSLFPVEVADGVAYVCPLCGYRKDEPGWVNCSRPHAKGTPAQRPRTVCSPVLGT